MSRFRDAHREWNPDEPDDTWWEIFDMKMDLLWDRIFGSNEDEE